VTLVGVSNPNCGSFVVTGPKREVGRRDAFKTSRTRSWSTTVGGRWARSCLLADPLSSRYRRSLRFRHYFTDESYIEQPRTRIIASWATWRREMSVRPQDLVPTTRALGPPVRLTQAQVGCLKTAVALVVVQRRWKERQAHLQDDTSEGRREPGRQSVLAQFLPPTVTTQTGTASSADCNEITVAGTEQARATHHHSKSPGDWVAHMDHMMGAAVRTPAELRTSKQFHSVVAHLASQLTSVVSPVRTEPEEYHQGQHEANVSTVRDWIYSYLVATDEAMGDLWTEIAFESHCVRNQHANDSLPTAPDLIVSCLVCILLDRLNLNKPLALRNAEDFYNLRLLASLLPLASLEAVNDCWLLLGVDHTPVPCGYATQYFEMCRRREALVNRPLAAPIGGGDSSDVGDVSRILFLRRELSEVFADLVKSSAAPTP
jgi:hypothetical protein